MLAIRSNFERCEASKYTSNSRHTPKSSVEGEG